MAFEKGNNLAANRKEWQQALKRALARKGGSVAVGLDKMADKIVAAAVDEGDTWAINHIAERLDGKPTQPIAGDEDHAPFMPTIDLGALTVEQARVLSAIKLAADGG